MQVNDFRLRFFQQRSSGDILARVASNTVIRDLVSEELISTLFDGSMVITYPFILFSQSFVFAAIVLLLGLLQVSCWLGQVVLFVVLLCAS
ncbi:MAG TPA: hypothetical protein VFU49_14240 [Ktedonobacteraceae bacterium]|nr:hypothetical protein [Ktedonobacteraceae bacterium]